MGDCQVKGIYFILCFVLTTLDACITWYGVNVFGVQYELNPIQAWLIENHGIIWMFVFKWVFFIPLAFVYCHVPMRYYVIVTFVYLTVVILGGLNIL